MALLQVRDVHVGFGSVEVLRGVTFDLHAGRTLG
ncbi:ABC transporter ATP-binding protein, partial [bacterium]